MTYYNITQMFKVPYITGQSYGLSTSGIRVTTETPQFTGPIENVTVALGREAVLSCSVTELGNYKVSLIARLLVVF